jgi:soluble P-type ATPase
MPIFDIPNYGKINLKNILFDMNGTIQFNGRVTKKLRREIKKLKSHFNVFLISSDTRGNLDKVALKLGVKSIKISPSGLSEAELKNNELLKLGKEETAAIGNGNNDSMMLKSAILGIAILGKEGLASKTLMNSDLAFSNCLDAIHFLMDEKKVIATLRK